MVERLPQELVKNLVDPETREPVRSASESEMARLREMMSAGKARRRDGGPLPESCDAAFVTRDGKRAYLVLEGIPNFLIDERIELDEPLGG